MRIGLVTLLLCSGCFAVSDADRPVERSPEHQTLLDAGVLSDAGSSGDAGVQPSDTPCQQTCTNDAECFWTKTGEEWQALCAETVRRENDQDLIDAFAQECVLFGPDCGQERDGEWRCTADNFPGECIENSGRFRCYQSRGPCSEGGECWDQDGNELLCLPTPQQAKHYEQAFHNRCLISGAGYDEAVQQGQIGLWISVNGSDVCGLTICDDEDVSWSCEDYVDGLDALNGVVNVFPVCADLRDTGDEAVTCDWRECEEDEQCVRSYRIAGASCREGWCEMDNDQSHFANVFAHGEDVSSDAPKGMPQCQYGDSRNGFHGCRDGEICIYDDTNFTLTGCLGCDDNSPCPGGSDCLGGFCRYACERDNDCISDREQCSDGGYCVEQSDHGGGGGGHPEFCHDLECQDGTYCTEIRLWVHERGSDVRRAVCLQDSCRSTDECAAGTACLRGRCQFSGLCNDADQCGMVQQDDRECAPFVDDSDINQVLCLSPDDHCSEDHECPDDGADCYLGFCGQMRQDTDGCDLDSGRYTLSHLGYCPRRFNRCAERGDGWCSDGRYCHDAEVRPPRQGDIGVHGALCLPTNEDDNECNPNLALGSGGDACPLGSTCAQVNWGQGLQWRCLFEDLCDPTAEQSNCEPGRVCDPMIMGDRYWCINPDSLCGDGCGDQETCVAEFCAAARAQCNGNQSVAVGTCVDRELIVEHPFANEEQDCPEGSIFEAFVPQAACVDLRAPCNNDRGCSGMPSPMDDQCIEGYCGMRAVCPVGAGYSDFAGMCEEAQAGSPCDSMRCEPGQICQETEHRWGDNTLTSAVCTPQTCAGHDDCGVGMRCHNQECGFGGFCETEADCNGQGMCTRQSGMGGGQNCLSTVSTAVGGCAEGEEVIAGFCVQPHAQNVACQQDRLPVDGTCQ